MNNLNANPNPKSSYNSNLHVSNNKALEANSSDDSDTKKMLGELSALKKKNQMYLDKIENLDNMSEKIKKQKQNDSQINNE